MFLQGNMMHSLERMPGGPIGASKGDDTAAEIRYLAFTTPFWEFLELVRATTWLPQQYFLVIPKTNPSRSGRMSGRGALLGPVASRFECSGIS